MGNWTRGYGDKGGKAYSRGRWCNCTGSKKTSDCERYKKNAGAIRTNFTGGGRNGIYRAVRGGVNQFSDNRVILRGTN